MMKEEILEETPSILGEEYKKENNENDLFDSFFTTTPTTSTSSITSLSSRAATTFTTSFPISMSCYANLGENNNCFEQEFLMRRNPSQTFSTMSNQMDNNIPSTSSTIFNEVLANKLLNEKNRILIKELNNEHELFAPSTMQKTSKRNDLIRSRSYLSDIVHHLPPQSMSASNFPMNNRIYIKKQCKKPEETKKEHNGNLSTCQGKTVSSFHEYTDDTNNNNNNIFEVSERNKGVGERRLENRIEKEIIDEVENIQQFSSSSSLSSSKLSSLSPTSSPYDLYSRKNKERTNHNTKPINEELDDNEKVFLNNSPTTSQVDLTIHHNNKHGTYKPFFMAIKSSNFMNSIEHLFQSLSTNKCPKNSTNNHLYANRKNSHRYHNRGIRKQTSTSTSIASSITSHYQQHLTNIDDVKQTLFQRPKQFHSFNSSFETKYVNDVYRRLVNYEGYDIVENQRPWPPVLKYLQSMSTGSLVLDAGCGTGRYFQCIPNDSHMIGCDICYDMTLKAYHQCKGSDQRRCNSITTVSHKDPTNSATMLKSENSLVDYSSYRSVNSVVMADTLTLPFRDKVFDGIICIGVLHHLSTEERRQQAIRELLRVLKEDGGTLLIYVWAFEQTHRNFTNQDVLIPSIFSPSFNDNESSKTDQNKDNNIPPNKNMSRSSTMDSEFTHIDYEEIEELNHIEQSVDNEKMISDRSNFLRKLFIPQSSLKNERNSDELKSQSQPSTATLPTNSWWSNVLEKWKTSNQNHSKEHHSIVNCDRNIVPNNNQKRNNQYSKSLSENHSSGINGIEKKKDIFNYEKNMIKKIKESHGKYPDSILTYAAHVDDDIRCRFNPFDAISATGKRRRIDQKYTKTNVDSKENDEQNNEKQLFRFYHLFRINELKQLIEKSGLSNIEIVEISYDHCNWTALIRRHPPT
ncbi:hypothetical protein SNEBB_009537 [Seison nebaliae]|nr:hypothetical protein SNEBB_009537 [Seison nebaliae]